MKDAESANLCVRVLGPFDVLLDGESIPDSRWPRKRTKTLLKVLLTAPGQPFSIDQLSEALLPSPTAERATAKNIQARVSELRRLLEPDLSRGRDSQYIVNVGDGYAFSRQSSYWLDAEAFAGMVDRADAAYGRSEWAPAAEDYEEALQLCRGEFLPEDLYAEWSQALRARLAETFMDASERLAACYLELGRHRQAIHWSQRVLATAPHRESAIRHLMRCYGEIGERSKAIEAYEAGVEALRQRLDIDPPDELRDLRDRIARQPHRPASTTRDSRRVAVIPFVTVGADPAAEFLADGMTEELIYTLSKVAGLEVIAQTTVLKYKEARKSVAEIGRELRVGSLLEGSVQKVDGQGRILVQLIDVESEAHLWAEQYDREIKDVLGVQGDIARHVVSALKVELLAREETALREAEAPVSEAHTSHMKGWLFLTKRTREGYSRAIEYFEQALSIEPTHARALAGLADAYWQSVGFITAEEGYERARHYARKALESDPTCAEAHATLGRVAWMQDGDVGNAERLFLRSIEIDPNYALAHELHADLLVHTGRNKEACQRSEIALALDPLSPHLVLTYAQSLHASGRFVEAVEQYQKALEIDPEMQGAWWGLWHSLALQWDWDHAEAVTRKCVEDHPENPYAHVTLSQCVRCMGRSEEALAEIQTALDVAGDPVPPFVLVHAGYAHYFSRRYDDAIHYSRQALEANPALSFAHNTIAKCHIALQRYDEALAELDAAEHCFGGADAYWNAQVHMDRGGIYALRGEMENAEKELAILLRSSEMHNRRFSISVLLFALGRTEEAMDWLEAATTAHEGFVIILGILTECDPMRSHPRFQALLERMGLAT